MDCRIKTLFLLQNIEVDKDIFMDRKYGILTG